MISRDFLKKIRRIQITTSRLVSDVFAGQYHSVFKGRGIEFDEVRAYIPGDEIRSIDWNVTARTGHPFVKKFTEEREMTVILLLDTSSSCRFGSGQQLKSQLAAEICSVLAFSAIKNNDRVGLLAFSDRVEKFLPPRKGTRHVLGVIREALFQSTEQTCRIRRQTDIGAALTYLHKVIKRRAVVFIISDFFCLERTSRTPAPDPASFLFRKQLLIAGKKHDCIAVTLGDPRETEMPDAGLATLEDAETGEIFTLDTTNENTRLMFKNIARSWQGARTTLFRQLGIDEICITTDKPYGKALIQFFKQREKRRGRQ